VVVVTVSVDVPDAAIDEGLKDAVAPLGKPLTLRPTGPLKPASMATAALYVVPLPAKTVRDDGDAVIEKSGTVIVRVAAVLVSPPLSVTVNEAVYVPGVEYVTAPGLATVLEDGLPPGKLHEYALIVPS
jgi:hypothetical protein